MSALLARSNQHAGTVVKAVYGQCHAAQAKVHAALRNGTIRPKYMLYAVLACFTGAWLALTFMDQLRRRMRQSNARPGTPNLEKSSTRKTADREPGGMLFTYLSSCYRYRLWLRYTY